MGVIKFKRGNNINFAGITLEAGEPAFVLDTGKLYLGDGTNKILINADNVATATTLQTSRLIGTTGDATGSASFDGSSNATITLVLANTGVSAGTYTKVTVDTKGRITSATSLSASDIPTLTLAKISDAGTSASKNTGTASGNVPILDANGKLDASVLPAIAITDTFVVANQTAMLALTAEVGDIAIRTDLNKSFILKTTGATVLANWQELLTPTNTVASVAGKTGVVTLTSSDVGLGNVQNANTTTTANITDSTNKRFMTDAQDTKLDAISGTNTGDETTATIKTKLGITTLSGSNTGDQDLSGLALKTTTVNGHDLSANVTVTKADVGLSSVDNTSDAGKPVSTAQQTALNLKANLSSPALIGTPTAPTASVATNTAQIATTAFVKAQGYITASDNIDGGTF